MENNPSNPISAAKDTQETADDAAYLPRFKIINLVGIGNYARVYRAITASGKEIAVKAINLSKTSENYRFKFLPRELNILRKIRHVNVCKIHEILHIADRIFILMQFCHKGTIADLLHKVGPLNESVARNLFAQTVDAVAYLHSVSIAHRDLKVENVLLDSEYCPKLTDFSYSTSCPPNEKLIKRSPAKPYTPRASSHNLNNNNYNSNYNISNQVSRSNSPSRISNYLLKQQKSAVCSPRASPFKLNDTFCGTLPYLSPEMIRQIPYDAKKNDIWSLGICLYVMLNDKLPFPFDDVKTMIKKQLSRDYKFKPNLEISDQVRDLISLMLEPDYLKRPDATDVARHQWMNGPRERPAS